MRNPIYIIVFICFCLAQNAFSYDECFKGSCYSHLNSGWSSQGGVGCVKIGSKWQKKYNKSAELRKLRTSFYMAINNSSSTICNRPSVLNMEMLMFNSSSQKFVEFKEQIKKAISWCWLATNNKLKFTKKNISGAFVTDNNLEVNLFLQSDGSIGKTFVRMETVSKHTGKNFHWMHFSRQDLTRLKNELSELKIE